MKGDAHKPKVLWRRGLCNDAKQLPDIPGKEMKRWKVWINGFIRLPCTNTVDCCHSSTLIARANASLAHRKHRWCSRAKDLQILPGALSTIPDWRFAAIDLEARRHIGLANINKLFSIVSHTIKTQETNKQRWKMDNFQTRIERPRYQLRSRGTPQAESFGHVQGCFVSDSFLHSRFLKLRAAQRKAQVFRPSIIAILKDWNFAFESLVFFNRFQLMVPWTTFRHHSFTPNLLEHHLPLTLDLMVWVAATLASQFS